MWPSGGGLRRPPLAFSLGVESVQQVWQFLVGRDVAHVVPIVDITSRALLVCQPLAKTFKGCFSPQ